VERQESSAEELQAYFLSGEGLRGVQAPPHQHASADGASTSVREFEYRGHQARIETTYRITIDGQPLLGHVEVLPDGAVHYHRFPQYAPSSAVDVVKAVIETVWDKPPVPDELGEPEPPGHGTHGPHGHHGGQE
jgi:hypothetical protein